MPSLARMLKAHKLASPFKRPEDFVFATSTGKPMYWRNVSKRGLTAAIERAGLDGDERPSFRFHDCRHTFASMLIAQGANIAYVSQQLGHASPAITLTIYTHEINRAEQAERTSAMLETAFGGVLS